MTDITLVLARYIGIYFLVAGIAVVARRDTIGQFVQRYREDDVLTFIAGVLALWFGLVVLALHWQWDDALAAAITFIGLLAAIKGIVCLLGQVFINDLVGGGLQNVFRKDGEEVFLGPTLESKSCGESKIGKSLQGIHDSIICLLPL